MSSVTVIEHEYLSEIPPVGYVVSVRSGRLDWEYGLFGSVELAVAYGSKLTNAIVKPVYAPSLH